MNLVGYMDVGHSKESRKSAHFRKTSHGGVNETIGKKSENRKEEEDEVLF